MRKADGVTEDSDTEDEFEQVDGHRAKIREIGNKQSNKSKNKWNMVKEKILSSENMKMAFQLDKGELKK